MLIDLKLICSINFVQFSALNENVAQFRTLNENGVNIFIFWLFAVSCKKTNRSMNFAEPERVKILFCRCRQIFHLGSVTQYHIFIKFSRPSLLAKDRLYIFVVEGCGITVICLYNPYYWINDEFIRRYLKMMLETYLKKKTTLNCKYCVGK